LPGATDAEEALIAAIDAAREEVRALVVRANEIHNDLSIAWARYTHATSPRDRNGSKKRVAVKHVRR
jgi:hypothetical protein